MSFKLPEIPEITAQRNGGYGNGCVVEYDKIKELHDLATRQQKAIEVLLNETQRAQRILNGIKYDLEASVYTAKDDEFEWIFSVRDFLYKAEHDAKKILNGDEK